MEPARKIEAPTGHQHHTTAPTMRWSGGPAAEGLVSMEAGKGFLMTSNRTRAEKRRAKASE